MTNLASDLRQRFEWALDLCLESYEVLEDGRSFIRSDRDENAIPIFERLGETVDEIPGPLIASAEELRSAQPELFERRLEQAKRAVGDSFMPTCAAEFLGRVLMA